MKRENYPDNWDEISLQVKQEAGWKCERCGEPHSVETWHILTTHHIIPDTSLNERWNLIALCQRCNLKAEAINRQFRLSLKTWRKYANEDWMMQQLKAYASKIREELLKQKRTKSNSKWTSLFGAGDCF